MIQLMSRNQRAVSPEAQPVKPKHTNHIYCPGLLSSSLLLCMILAKSPNHCANSKPLHKSIICHLSHLHRDLRVNHEMYLNMLHTDPRQILWQDWPAP